jgi:glycosyltransferase involved in cell wall biosynthesis
VYSGNLYGGVEAVLATIARERDCCGGMESHFALCFGGRLFEELESAGAPVHLLGRVSFRRPLTVRRARRALAALLGRESFDVVICHSAWPLAVFGPVVRARGVPLVSWIHDVPARGHWVDALARRTRTEMVICNSAYTASAQRASQPGARIEILHPPVSPPSADASARDAIRASLDTPADAVVVIQASRLTPGKGHELLLNALVRLADVPGWVHWQVGGAQQPSEERYARRLRSMVESSCISERVRFVGQRDDVPQLLGAADVHCQPNCAPDSFGVAFVEALGAGLPVATTAMGGALEIVDDSCGTLVPPGDETGLVSALSRLITDAGFRAKLGACAPSRARELCDPAKQLARLHAILSEVSHGHVIEARL